MTLPVWASNSPPPLKPIFRRRISHGGAMLPTLSRSWTPARFQLAPCSKNPELRLAPRPRLPHIVNPLPMPTARDVEWSKWPAPCPPGTLPRLRSWKKNASRRACQWSASCCDRAASRSRRISRTACKPFSGSRNCRTRPSSPRRWPARPGPTCSPESGGCVDRHGRRVCHNGISKLEPRVK